MLSKPFLKYETRIKMCHNFSDFIMSTLQILSRHDLTTQIDLNIKPTAALWTYRSSLWSVLNMASRQFPNSLLIWSKRCWLELVVTLNLYLLYSHLPYCSETSLWSARMAIICKRCIFLYFIDDKESWLWWCGTAPFLWDYLSVNQWDSVSLSFCRMSSGAGFCRSSLV